MMTSCGKNVLRLAASAACTRHVLLQERALQNTIRRSLVFFNGTVGEESGELKSSCDAATAALPAALSAWLECEEYRRIILRQRINEFAEQGIVRRKLKVDAWVSIDSTRFNINCGRIE